MAKVSSFPGERRRSGSRTLGGQWRCRDRTSGGVACLKISDEELGNVLGTPLPAGFDLGAAPGSGRPEAREHPWRPGDRIDGLAKLLTGQIWTTSER